MNKSKTSSQRKQRDSSIVSKWVGECWDNQTHGWHDDEVIMIKIDIMVMIIVDNDDNKLTVDIMVMVKSTVDSKEKSLE